MELPGLPPLSKFDLPSVIILSSKYPSVLPIFKDHLEILDEETDPKVFANTFDALECEALSSIDNYKLVGLGPLIHRRRFWTEKIRLTSLLGEIFSKVLVLMSSGLTQKSESSVIYISFGTIIKLSKQQLGEMLRALHDMDSPFLLAMKESEKEEDELMILKEQGMVVPWCSQLEVLSRNAIGCFVTHCGWNSSLESLVFGVPVVAFPQWADQFTNTKLVQDVCITGVRLRASDDGVVESEEINRCVH